MPSHKILLALLAGVTGGLAVGNAVVFSEMSCGGRQQDVPNGRCTTLRSGMRDRAQGAIVPTDVVCDFYR
ncbi:hypothetical protein E4U52_007475 [Claviceps spartinae]|nr:hypothetical protein E4U52_007475 [Claviceps spartinae]